MTPTLPNEVLSSGVNSELKETVDGQSRLAHRLAALVLLTNILISCGIDGALALGSTFTMPLLIDFVLAINLLRFKRWARDLALARALLGGVLIGIHYFLNYDLLIAMALTIMYWGLSSTIYLLLTGRRITWPVALGVAPYVVLRVVPDLVIYLARVR